MPIWICRFMTSCRYNNSFFKATRIKHTKKYAAYAHNHKHIFGFLHDIFYFPVPKREVSMPDSFFGLKPLKRHMNVSLRLRVISRTFIR